MQTAVLLNTDTDLEEETKTLAKKAGLTLIAFSDTVTVLNALGQMAPVPNFLIINMQDFPRHWKIIKMTVDPRVSILLFSRSTPDEKETQKAQSLGIPWFTSAHELFAALKLDPPTKTQAQEHPPQEFVNATIVLSHNKKLWIGNIDAMDAAGISCTGLPNLSPGLHSVTIVLPGKEAVDIAVLSVANKTDRLLFTEPLNLS